MTNSEANKTLAALLAFVFMLGAASVVFIFKAKADIAGDLAQQTLFSCETTDATTHTADAVSLLMAAGWTSTPADHAERLYSPACNVEVRGDGDVVAWDTNGEVVVP